MKRNLILAFIFLIVMLVNCTSTTGSGNIEVQEIWGRSSPNVAQNGAIYMVITNNTGQDDQLLGVLTDACAAVELHQMKMGENDMMIMGEVPGGLIELPAGESVELQVGGLHVMCIDKQIDFETGAAFPITLDFNHAEDIEVAVEIRDTADGSMDMENMDSEEMDMGEE